MSLKSRGMVLPPLSYCQTENAPGQDASCLMPGFTFTLLEIDFFKCIYFFGAGELKD